MATLHTFGERDTERLRDRLLRELRPARTLRAPAPGGAVAVSVPAGVSGLAFGRGRLWVATEPGTWNASLRRIDPVTLSRRSVPGVARTDVRVAAGPAGVWASGVPISRTRRHIGPLEAVRLDSSNGRVLRRVALGRLSGGGLAMGADAVWVSTNHPRWYSGPRATGSVWRLDPRTGRVRWRTRLREGAGALAVAGGSVWVAGSGSPVVFRLDGRTGRRLGAVRVGPRPFALAAAAGDVWVTDSRDGTVRQIDARSGRVERTVRVGRAPHGIAADRRGV